jgi:ABC-type transport system involved in cytochrome c biogenesis ATPase subunit
VSDAADLTAVSFDELAAMVHERLERSYHPTVADRQKLLELIDELRSGREAGTSAGLLGTAGWQLVRVTVQGFGGIENHDGSLTVDLATGPTITLVRGDNGSGKTSLVSALDFGLLVGRPTPGTGSSGALWQADRVSDGAAEGTVEIHLVRDAASLIISGRCPREGAPTVVARLVSNGRDEPMELGDAWIDALAASNACFTYAALQARLQKSTDLQSYLEELLVLGPVWQLVHSELDKRAASATADRKALDKLRAAGRADERKLAERFGADPRQPAPPRQIQWPSRWSDDVDEWLDANGLTGTGPAITVKVAAHHEQRAEEITTEVTRAWRALDAAQGELDSPEIAPVLHHLERLVEHAELNDSQCPVCGQAADWREAARLVLGRVKDRAKRVSEVREAVATLSSWVDEELAPLLEAGIAGGPHGAVEAFRREARHDGLRPRPALRQVAEQLGSALADPVYADWLSRLRDASDATAEWADARRRLVTQVVPAWRDRGSGAADADSWDTATKTLAELQREERQRRQNLLTTRLQDAVDRLLPDAGIRLEEITHKGGIKQQRGVELRMTIGGRRATLGMLSSGQRNALLLASLLCIGPPAPFGFVVIDDPVHALDDLRIDRLARELTKLAQNRQVIVLTHDARLEEHLRARNPALHTRVLHRDVERSAVRADVVDSPWDQLLQQASTVLYTAAKDDWRVDAPVPDVVGGLCRNALDGAIRHAVVTRAVRLHTAISDALAALDKAGHTTRSRIEHVLDLAGGPHALPCTTRCRDEYLDGWNDGAHGGSSEHGDLKAEITAARAACKELKGWQG